MKKEIYRQCELVRLLPEGRGMQIDVSWIPNKMAKLGRTLQIRQEDDSWEDGWVVRKVWSARDFSELELQRDAHKRWDDVLADH